MIRANENQSDFEDFAKKTKLKKSSIPYCLSVQKDKRTSNEICSPPPFHHWFKSNTQFKKKIFLWLEVTSLLYFASKDSFHASLASDAMH